MVNIGILSSTKATDAQAIIEAIEHGHLHAKISVIISDRENAYCLERAKMHSIPGIYVNPKGRQREDFDKEVAEILDQHSVKLILMIGYMRIVTPWFVNRYRNQIMNIHPSLLPAFAGGMDMDVHKTVLDSGAKVTGCTLHFVTEGVDAGPIIMQKEVKIGEGETPGSLKVKVQHAEQEVLLKAIGLFAQNKILVEGSKVTIIP